MDDETGDESLAGAAEDDAAAGAGGGLAGTAVLDAVCFGGSFSAVLDAIAEAAGENGGVTGTARRHWPASGSQLHLAAYGVQGLDAAGGAAVAWPARPGGDVDALLDASGWVAVSGEADDDICLIASRIFLAGVDCSGSDLILQLSIAIMGNL